MPLFFSFEITSRYCKIPQKLLVFYMQNVSGILIKQTVLQVEKLEEQKNAIQEQIKEVFDNAKINGLDVQVLKKLIKLRKQKPEEINEQEELLDLYKRAMDQAE